VKQKNTASAPHIDRLVDFREANRLIGSSCKTSHASRELARRGFIKAIYLSSRCMRFSEQSILKFINEGQMP